jgi:hypothetical protein
MGRALGDATQPTCGSARREYDPKGASAVGGGVGPLTYYPGKWLIENKLAAIRWRLQNVTPA